MKIFCTESYEEPSERRSYAAIVYAATVRGTVQYLNTP